MHSGGHAVRREQRVQTAMIGVVSFRAAVGWDARAEGRLGRVEEKALGRLLREEVAYMGRVRCIMNDLRAAHGHGPWGDAIILCPVRDVVRPIPPSHAGPAAGGHCGGARAAFEHM